MEPGGDREIIAVARTGIFVGTWSKFNESIAYMRIHFLLIGEKEKKKSINFLYPSVKDLYPSVKDLYPSVKDLYPSVKDLYPSVRPKPFHLHLRFLRFHIDWSTATHHQVIKMTNGISIHAIDPKFPLFHFGGR